MKFLIVAESGKLAEHTVFDFEKMEIVRLYNGVYTNITEECKRLSKRKNAVIGGLWYKLLNGEIDRRSALIWDDAVVIDTDNKKDVDKILLNTQKAQIEFMLQNVNAYISKLENGKQVYTYRFW